MRTHTLLALCLVLLLAATEQREPQAQFWQSYLLQRTQALTVAAQDFSKTLPKASAKERQDAFIKLRSSWKALEPMLAYYFPSLAKELNDAPLPKVDPVDKSYQTTIPPQGLQRMEELVYQDVCVQDCIQELRILSGSAQLLERKLRLVLNAPRYEDWRQLDVISTSLVRIFTLGLSGFDTPASGQSLEESRLQLLEAAHIADCVDSLTPGPGKRSELKKWALKARTVAQKLSKQDFDHFDRIHFIRNDLSPLYTTIKAIQTEAEARRIEGGGRTRPSSLGLGSKGFFSRDFLDWNAFFTGPRPSDSSTAWHLGRALFNDPRLSGDSSLSCASCHDPAKGFADGKKVAPGHKGQLLDRNSPGLMGAIFQRSFFWDGRATVLNEQVDHVVFSPKEFATDYMAIEARLRTAPYAKSFAKAYPDFPGNAIAKSTITAALAWYVASLRGGDNEFARFMRGDVQVLDSSAYRGANLFWGKALCATCHFAPTFGGTAPPLYTDTENEVIGTVRNANWTTPVLDEDKGKGKLFPDVPLWQRAFKTPILLNVARTAPYMHHGGIDSLVDVIEFYHKGGGQGLGLDVPNQTLPFDSLTLSPRDKADLVAFLKTLNEPVVP